MTQSTTWSSSTAGLDLAHGVLVLQVGAAHFVRIGIGRGHLVEAGDDALADRPCISSRRTSSPISRPSITRRRAGSSNGSRGRNLAGVLQAHALHHVDLHLLDLLVQQRAAAPAPDSRAARVSNTWVRNLVARWPRPPRAPCSAHFVAQRRHAAFAHAEGRGECVIDRRQEFLFHRLHREVEFGGLAGQVLAAVVVGKGHRRGLRSRPR